MSDNPSSLDELFTKLSLTQNQHLVDEAKDLECPFTWLSSEGIALDQRLDSIENKFTEGMRDDRKWRLFILNLALCYEYCLVERTEDAVAKLEAIDSYADRERNHSESDKDISISFAALSHIALACHYFIDLKLGRESDVLTKIQKMELSEEDHGSIWGIKAAVFMEYGSPGTKASITFSEKAIKLDPEQPEWHFLLGKALARVRRTDHFHEPPCKRELEALETADSLREDAGYKVFLAQTYREHALKTYLLNKGNMYKLTCECGEMNRKALGLYCAALRLEGNSSVQTRCGIGFMKLPRPYQDLGKAKQCLLEAVRTNPKNAQAHHMLGECYEKMRDITKAEHHLTLAEQYSCAGAMFSLIRIKVKQNPFYNPLPVLEYMLPRYSEKFRRYDILCQMGSYWYFVKKNFLEALKSWKIVFEEEPDCYKMEVHTSLFTRMKEPVNLLQVMFNEARTFVERRLGTQEDRDSMIILVSKIRETHPEFH